jgi:hypothetical protein
MSCDDFMQRWNERSWRERLSWLSKPRLPTAIFERIVEFDLFTTRLDAAFPSPDVKAAFDREREKLIQKIEETKSQFGWDSKRFDDFTRLVVAFRKEPSIENYVTIRKSFPELDIQIAMSGGIDALFSIEEKLREYGIDPGVVASALDGFEPNIDKLCLTLMDLIIARNSISGIGKLQRRRAAISDAMIKYLLALMLEALDWCDEEVRVPASLILLLRHQLGPLKGDLHEECDSREARNRVAWIAAQLLQPNEKLSINRLVKLASATNNPLPRSTAARWLKDKYFLRCFELYHNPKYSDLRLERFPIRLARIQRLRSSWRIRVG